MLRGHGLRFIGVSRQTNTEHTENSGQREEKNTSMLLETLFITKMKEQINTLWLLLSRQARS